MRATVDPSSAIRPHACQATQARSHRFALQVRVGTSSARVCHAHTPLDVRTFAELCMLAARLPALRSARHMPDSECTELTFASGMPNSETRGRLCSGLLLTDTKRLCCGSLQSGT